MPSLHYYCPHRGEKVLKPSRVLELAELLAQGKTHVVSAEGDSVTCPCCKKPVDVMKMAKGQYDMQLPGKDMAVVVLSWIGLTAILRYGVDIDWVWAAIAGAVGSTFVMWALAKRRLGRVPDSMV